MYYCNSNHLILKFFNFLCWITLVFLFSFTSWSQELPPIKNYPPLEYVAENQNWAISQSDNKYIYVANNSGLLEFNGAKWKLYPSPNNTILRSVNVINNKIYTGCYMEFGYWERNEFGVLTYNSLLDKLRVPLIEDEQIWNILSVDSWILFQSLNRIYIYNTINESFRVINSNTDITKVFKAGKGIYFQKLNDGVYKIENGEAFLISDNAILKNDNLINIFLVDKKLLLQTQRSGFYFLENQVLSKWNISANKELSSQSVYSSLMLKNGSFILGTISNGIYQISKNGDLILNINQNKGILNNTILSMFEDSEENLWLGLDNGISVINFNSPYNFYNDASGLVGTVYASAIFENRLYLGTNHGLFYKKYNSNDNFKFIKGTNGQVWCLKVIDNNLFCGHNEGTYLVKENKADLISNVRGTWDIKTIENEKNLLIQGNYNGLNILEKISGSWKFRNKIEGFANSSRFFEFESPSTIFVNHEYKGVFKLTINSAYTKVTDYTIEKSCPKGLKSSLSTYHNELLYTFKNGIYVYKQKQQKFVKDSILTNSLFNEEEFISGKLIEDKKNNTLWGFTLNNIIYFSEGHFNKAPKVTKIPLPASLRQDVIGYENILNIQNNNYLLGTSQGYILIDIDKLADQKFEVSINEIEKSFLNQTKSKISLKGATTLPYIENNLFFNFSVPEFDKFTEVNYQYRLKGLYNNWSNWSTSSEVSFKNLPFGSYNFNVRAKIGNKISQNTASFPFIIKRPWYLSNYAIALYILIFFTILYIIHSVNRFYYKKQQQKVIDDNKKMFEIKQLESEQKLMKLRNKQLNQEIESKNRELTISTMSIIKKNEILNQIKRELLENQNKIKGNNKVIKSIDKNINNKEDWEFLEAAFNNADKDFLKKIKSIHPNLTPNDLRFCAYLRLNLSSKEIAPLLNISVRSVEIKRYRLRKKMQLSHEKSLVAYILSI